MTPRVRFRADIEGLRAAAILAVVLYHAHVGAVGGGYIGVDVFFVISGFLITDHLWRELRNERRLSFVAFYGRRVRRLLPAAMLVLAATVLASAVWLPPLQARTVWKDALASALYVGNYRFAFTGTDYLASTLPSPFQHYWSLGVEEQFYLLWPLLLVLAGLGWRRRGAAPGAVGGGPRGAVVGGGGRGVATRARVVVAIGAIAAGSFAFSLWLTHADEPWAFFSLPSRAWELAVGALVALAAAAIRRFLRTGAATVVGWAGLAAIVWATFGFTSSTPFPGTAALLPVLGAAAIIAAGLVDPPSGPVLVLGTRGMRAVGRISYSWYLWHWPVLILAPYVVGHSLGEWEYLLLAVASAALAVLTYRFVERPVQRSRWLAVRPRRSLGLAVPLTATGVAACLIAVASLPPLVGHGRAPVAAIHLPSPVSTVPPAGVRPAKPPVRRRVVTPLESAEAQVVAAVARSATVADVPANLDPSLAAASSSESAPFVDGCLLGFVSTYQPPCVFGDTTSSQSVVLLGDSHATMWFPAVDSYADAAHLALRVWTKATCPPIELSIYTPELGRPFTECDEWKSGVLASLASLRPKLVVLGTAPNYDLAYQVVQDGPQWLQGLAAMIAAIRRTGAAVAVIGPVPSPNGYVADCLSAHLTDMAACATPPTGGPDGNGLVGYDVAGMTAERTTVERAGGFFVDVKPWFCTATTCPAVVDNLLVYRDNSHITVPYATYLAPLIAGELGLARARRP